MEDSMEVETLEHEKFSDSLLESRERIFLSPPVECGKEILHEAADVVRIGEHCLISFDHFEIVGQLNTGDVHSNLYLCHYKTADCVLWTSNKRLNAIELKQKFVREAKYVLQLIHPALAEIEGVSFEDSRGYPVPMVMYKNIEGKSLAAMLEDQSAKSMDIRLDSVRKMILLTGIASAIAYLHSKGLCHGRIDSSNVFLSANHPYPRILRYGFCDFFSRDQGMGFVKDIHDFGIIAEEILRYGNGDLMEGPEELTDVIHKCINNSRNMKMADVLKAVEEHLLLMSSRRRTPNKKSETGIAFGTAEEYHRYLKYLKTMDRFRMDEFMYLPKKPLDLADILTDIAGFVRKLIEDEGELSLRIEKMRKKLRIFSDYDTRHTLMQVLEQCLKTGNFGFPVNRKAYACLLREMLNAEYGHDDNRFFERIYNDLLDEYRALSIHPNAWDEWNNFVYHASKYPHMIGVLSPQEITCHQNKRWIEIAKTGYIDILDDDGKVVKRMKCDEETHRYIQYWVGWELCNHKSDHYSRTDKATGLELLKEAGQYIVREIDSQATIEIWYWDVLRRIVHELLIGNNTRLEAEELLYWEDKLLRMIKKDGNTAKEKDVSLVKKALTMFKWMKKHKFDDEVQGIDAAIQGFNFLYGINGLPKIHSYAYACYERAALVNGMCAFLFGNLHRNTTFGPDIEKVKSFWKKAAEMGDSRARYCTNLLLNSHTFSQDEMTQQIDKVISNCVNLSVASRAPDFAAMPMLAGVINGLWNNALDTNILVYFGWSDDQKQTTSNANVYVGNRNCHPGSYRTVHWIRKSDTDIQKHLYAIASVMEWLHGRGIIARNFSHEILDSEFRYNKDGEKYTYMVFSSYWPGSNCWKCGPLEYRYGREEKDRYFAPELRTERPDVTSDWFDEKVDVYSFGVLMCRVFNIHRFDVDMDFHVIESTLERKKVSEVFIDLIRRCLSLNPECRPSFKEIVDLLATYDVKKNVDAEEFKVHRVRSNRVDKYTSPEIAVCDLAEFAKSEDLNALLDTADSYFYAENGFPLNCREAAKHYELAANQNNPYAEVMLAYMCVNGLGTAVHLPKAHQFYQRAIRHSTVEDENETNPRRMNINARAKVEYALLLKTVDAQPHRDRHGFKYAQLIKEVVNSSNPTPEAWYQYGVILEASPEGGFGHVSALYWYRKAADAGHFEGLCRYCSLFRRYEYLGEFFEYSDYLVENCMKDDLLALLAFCRKGLRKANPAKPPKMEPTRRQVSGDETDRLLNKLIEDVNQKQYARIRERLADIIIVMSEDENMMKKYCDLCVSILLINEEVTAELLQLTRIVTPRKKYRLLSKAIMYGKWLATQGKVHMIREVFKYHSGPSERNLDFIHNLRYFELLAGASTGITCQPIVDMVKVIERMLETEWFVDTEAASEMLQNVVHSNPELQELFEKKVKKFQRFRKGKMNPLYFSTDYEFEDPEHEMLFDIYRWFNFALNYLKTAVECNNSHGCALYGKYVMQGRGLPPDAQKGSHFLVGNTYVKKKAVKDSKGGLKLKNMKEVAGTMDMVKIILGSDECPLLSEFSMMILDTPYYEELDRSVILEMEKLFTFRCWINGQTSFDRSMGGRDAVEVAKIITTFPDTKNTWILLHRMAKSTNRRELQLLVGASLIGGYESIGPIAKQLWPDQGESPIHPSVFELVDKISNSREDRYGGLIEKDEVKGVHYLWKSCQQKCIPALYQYGMLLCYGKTKEIPAEFDIDKSRGIEYLKEVADMYDDDFPKGFAPAKFEWGNRLLTGRGVEEDVVEAFKYLDAASEMGHIDAKLLLTKKIFCSYNLVSQRRRRMYIDDVLALDIELSDLQKYKIASILWTTGETPDAKEKACAMLRELKDVNPKAKMMYDKIVADGGDEMECEDLD